VHGLVGEEQQNCRPDIAPLGASAPSAEWSTRTSRSTASTFSAATTVTVRSVVFTTWTASTARFGFPTTTAALFRLPDGASIFVTHDAFLLV
jgi:hypothetical protein